MRFTGQTSDPRENLAKIFLTQRAKKGLFKLPIVIGNDYRQSQYDLWRFKSTHAAVIIPTFLLTAEEKRRQDKVDLAHSCVKQVLLDAIEKRTTAEKKAERIR